MTSLSGSVLSRLQSAYSRPLPQRCNEIEQIIHSTGTQELKNVLPSLLSSIFGYGSDSGWQLHMVSRLYNLPDFESVRRFLGPEGPLLSLIYNLQQDTGLMYEFSMNQIPGPSRRIIEDGNIPHFYINKLHTQGYGSHMILLSAFEYYMFQFAYCLVNWHNLSWNILTDHLYPVLLDDYLNYFLPLNKSSLPPMPHQQSPVRSPVVHSKVYSPSGRANGSPRTLGLLKSGFVMSQKQQNASMIGQSETETLRSEMLLQILVEFWLNQNSLESDRNMVGSPHSPVRFQYIFDRLIDHFMPTLEHIRLVRMMIKHVHHFVNSASQDIITSPYQTSLMSPLDEFKRSILRNMIQKNMYAFLRHSFDRWPLDNSFRMVLETWLTYIQPWRYTSLGNPSGRRDSEGENKVIDDKWFPFVEDNLLFYSVLVQEFFGRVMRMDLMNILNTHMLYRVAKVFRLENLDIMLRQAEEDLCTSVYRASHMTRDLGGSYLSPEPNLMLHSQIADLERPGFQYLPMFGKYTKETIKQILHQLTRIKVQIQSQQRNKPIKSGMAGFFSRLFEDSSVGFGDLSLPDVKKLLNFIDQSVKNLCFLFQLPESDFVVHTNTTQDISWASDLDDCPDMEETRDGVFLTPIGRYQIRNKLKKFDVMYTGDPDLQPIRSYENATVVRLLHQFCSYINTQFSNEIHTAYERKDLIGRLAQVFFAPAIPKEQKPKSPISGKKLEELRRPKLRLRFLASYSTMIYLALLFLFLNLWFNVGPVQYVLLLLAFTFMFGLLRAVSMSSGS